MNLLIHEFKSNLKALSFWSIGIILLVALSVGKTSGMVGKNSDKLQEILHQLPQSVQTIFGVGVVDYATAIGVFSIVLTYIALIVAFHATSVGVSCFGKEERDKTFEFLYVKGLTRPYLLSMKLINSLLQIILLNIITYGVSVGIAKAGLGADISKEFFTMMLGLFFLQLVFFGIGFFLSFLTKRMKLASNIASVMVIFCFLAAIFADLSKTFSFLKYITPFKYFDGKEILTSGLSPVYIIVSVLVTGICVVWGFLLHNKRDLHC